ncbi:uncharacterized protein FOMMEDRAFT_160059 [Fomitiporia mediterranea MF3/22]|uniref:uncharacterized protein n=1 Tax=Fomitiporia mediterranea (strain MF3/22) TaxID=694068 RepID=UPI0004409653|nr:uncharacterized protein FOMMEDRAFT_160059 [Fomitiporia mediterranea MF3/22]EJC99633.1 hypothetical protein FOMMEDRAFT_160059 [Fomitiporia mediterranea MF3/22]
MALSRRKGAGFTFTDNQLFQIASNIKGRQITQRITAIHIVCKSQEKDNVGVIFYHIYLPEGVDNDKEEDDKRAWMLVMTVQDLEPTETHFEFSDILLDEKDLAIKRGLDWMVEHGIPEAEARDRWMTVSSWSRRKGAGFTFTDNQLFQIASNIKGRLITQRITAIDIVCKCQENDHIGVIFYHIFLPEGVDDDKEEDDKRRWMLVMTVQDLEPTETHFEFSDIPFNEKDPVIRKGLKFMTDHGIPEAEARDRWMTVSSWSVRDE